MSASTASTIVRSSTSSFLGDVRREELFLLKGSTIVGDVHPAAYAVSGAYTPVPGGVGPLTIAMLDVEHCPRRPAPPRAVGLMLRVGLTGGLGSGKSTIGKMFAELGAHVIDADEVGRNLMQPGQSVYDRIVEHFGQQVVRSDGSLDRRALAELAFGRRPN